MSMHVFSWTSWFFAACMGIVSAAGNKTSGVMEVDLVFPRNQTYAPMESLPIVFAYQNTELAPLLYTDLSIILKYIPYPGAKVSDGWSATPLTAADISSTDPYFLFAHYSDLGDFTVEGTWMLKWHLTWLGCTAESLAQGVHSNSSDASSLEIHNHTTSILFTIKNGSQAVDFAAPTQENDCSAGGGIAIDITDTLKVPSGLDWNDHFRGRNESCAVLATSTPTANPCRVKIDSAAAASISVSLDPSICNGTTNLPAGCPESSAQGLLVGGVWFLAAAIGVVGYLLV